MILISGSFWQNLHPYFTERGLNIYQTLVKIMPADNMVTGINMSDAAVVVINDVEAKKLEVGHIVINIVPSYICLDQPLELLRCDG